MIRIECIFLQFNWRVKARSALLHANKTTKKCIQFLNKCLTLPQRYIILTVCHYQYWLPEDINSQPERKTNTQVTLILFDWKTSESFLYMTYED